MCFHILSHMPNLTLAIPEELHEKMKHHSEIRWSEVVRKSLSEKIRDLELLEKISGKSRLTPEDIRKFSRKVNREVFKTLNA